MLFHCLLLLVVAFGSARRLRRFILEEYYKKISDSYTDHIPSYLKEIKDEIDEMYMEYSTKVKYLHEMYSK